MKKILFLFAVLCSGSVSFGQWSASTLPGPGLGREIYMISPSTGFLTTMSQNGSILDAYLYKTVNSGSSWTLVKTLLGSDAVFPYLSFGLEDFDFPTSTTGYCAGVNYVYGFLCKTTDGGTTWDTTTFTGITDGFDCIDFTDANTGYFGGGDYIFKTTDGGVSINPIHSTGTGQVYDIEFVNSTTGFATTKIKSSTNQGYILKTVDAGVNWTTVHSSNNSNITSISMANSTTGFAIANNTFFKTTNGGTTWVESTPFTGIASTWEVHAVSPSIVYVSGVTSSFSRVILKSINGGTSWSTDYSEMSVTLFYNFSFSGSTAMAISPDNFVKTTNAPLAIESLLAENSIKLYPNPAESFLNVEMMEQLEVTSLKVYDAFGKLILNETKNVGMVNIESLVSGIYFLSLESNTDIIYTGKFIKE